uniref:54S ribosomal protein L51-like n=1 Tax=Rhizophora mucronata TaxID=61149 RepID=A0A2P2JVY6_RHIMU
MQSHMPAFKEQNPQLEVMTELIRGQHPHLKAFYMNFTFLHGRRLQFPFRDF